MGTIETIHRVSAFEHSARASRPDYVRRLVRTVISSARWFDAVMERRRSRLALLEMTDDQLKDIGISRCDAHREGIRSIWD